MSDDPICRSPALRHRCRSWQIIVTLAISMVGCIRANSVTLGRKTDLERQLMGQLEPLSEEELLAASVRAPSDTVLGAERELEDRALAARRRQLFNRDDLQVLKRAGCVGEKRDGTIANRPCDGSELLEDRDRIVEEENRDRSVIIEWAIDADPQLTPGDRAQMRSVYHTLLVERSPAATPVEGDDGQWSPKK